MHTKKFIWSPSFNYVCGHRNWSTWFWRRLTDSCSWWRLRRVVLSTCRTRSLPFWTSCSPSGLAARSLSRSIRMTWTNWGNSWAHLRTRWQVRVWRSLLATFPSTYFMRILEYRKKNAGWKHQDVCIKKLVHIWVW